MRSRWLSLVAGVMVTLALLTGPAAATDAPNQGDPMKVLKVNNKNVWCKDPTPLRKVEGDFGRTIYVKAKHPIDFVTVKSGEGAYVVDKKFGIYWGKIKLSKDISNYVIWVCKNHY
jgi:hypothetical protein